MLRRRLLLLLQLLQLPLVLPLLLPPLLSLLLMPPLLPPPLHRWCQSCRYLYHCVAIVRCAPIFYASASSELGSSTESMGGCR
jgi:hypothetical protein